MTATGARKRMPTPVLPRKDPVRLLIDLGKAPLYRMKAAVREAAKEREWQVLDLSLTRWVMPQGYQPDLAIVVRSPGDPLCRKLRNMGVKIVREGQQRLPGDGTVPAVLTDSEAEGRMAAEYYGDRDFRHVGVAHNGHMSEANLSFRAHAVRLGCQFHELDLSRPRFRRKLSSSERLRQEESRFCEWAERLPHPTGLFQAADMMAARSAGFCIQAGLAVPDQIALLGRGNSEHICEFSPIRISSIDLDYELRVATCIRILDDMLAGREVDTTTILIPPKGIVTRDSTDVHAAHNPDVAKALRHIWDHYDDMQMSVDTIAEVVGFSRRKLERLFRADTGRTVNQLLLSRRLERCCEFLSTTDIKTSELHLQVGLRSSSYLYRAFKGAFGITLNQYRTRSRD